MANTATKDTETVDLTNPSIIRAELKKTIDFLRGPRFVRILYTYFVFSPDYNRVWDREWGKYDKLEMAREACGAEGLDWQNELEEYRESEQKERDNSYWDNSTDLRSKTPLIECLMDFSIERLGDAPVIDRLQGWKTAMASWKLFCELYESNAQSFRQYLSEAQRASFLLLDDWWHSRYCSTGDMDSFKNSLEELVSTTFIWPPTRSHFPSTWTIGSVYYKICLDLFMREFHPMEWEPYNPHSLLSILMKCRKSTAKEAISMRFAFFALKSKLKPSYPSDPSSYPAYPQYARDKQLWRENEYFNEPPTKDGVSRECWELIDMLSPDPTYLWDVEAKKTIRVQQHRPEYVCISHTWGRWAIKPPSLVDIPGVPWKVKENSLYNVQDLPDMLLKLNHKFIWLDLFCLPQDDSPEHRAEVANQTAIFHRAKACIAWLNDVETWDGTKAAMDYLGLRYLRTSVIDQELAVSDECLEACIATAAGQRLELMKADSENDEPSSWFSSLWTLQETALCPDLHLCTRGMELLVDKTGTPISLSTLMAILGHLKTSKDRLAEFPSTAPFKIIPECVSKLFQLKKMTKLDWLLEYLSPMDIIVASNTRTCKRSRAIAIMNALDLLDWYKAKPKVDQSGKDDKEEALVLNTFPIEFVREAARKHGALFYTAFKPINSYRVKRFEGLWGFSNIPIGSMMPFSDIHGWETSVTRAVTIPTLQRKDHESVASWRINENASVRIRSAGILSCSNDSTDKSPIKSFVATMEEEERLKIVVHGGGQTDLHTSLKELAGEKMVFYAVVLYEDLGQKFGILLQMPKTRIPKPGKRWLIKVGFFQTLESLPPTPSIGVNWFVA